MARTARVFALLLAGCLALSGCLRTDADLYVDAEGRVSGDMFLGVDPDAVPEPQRSQLRDEIEQKIGASSWPAGVSPRYVQRDDFVGAQLVFQNVPPDQYRESVEQAYRAAGIAGSTYPTFTRRGDDYLMQWQPRIQYQQTVVPDQVNATVTFPGDVLDSNGVVPQGKDNTSQWTTGTSQEPPLLQATGSAIPNGALLKPFDTLVRGLVFIAGLAAAGLILWVVWWNVKRRRSGEVQRA